MTELLSSVTSTATALLTPEFWAVQWPLWRASVLTCASILLFRICYRFFFLLLSAYFTHISLCVLLCVHVFCHPYHFRCYSELRVG